VAKILKKIPALEAIAVPSISGQQNQGIKQRNGGV
jgi:hypothetical protein